MAQQVRLRNSIVACLLWTLSSCYNKTDDNKLVAIPHYRLNVHNAKLHHKEGVLVYDNIPFSGYTYDLYANGDTAKQTPYYKGWEEGWMKAWYENRQLSELRFFKQGRKEGTHKGWWTDGSPKFEYHFYNDEHEGELKEWYTNRRLAKLFHYAKGYEEGAEKMWWDNGDIRANYFVKSGERYGLTGQKLCSSNLDKKP